jgi:hypothetical protein
VPNVSPDSCGFQLAPPPTALEAIGNLRPPCRESMDWTRWPRPFINFLLGRSGCVFGTLVLLGTFADHERRRYIIPTSGSYCQCPDITAVVRQAHYECLSKWLRLNVGQKRADLSTYLHSVSGQAHAVLNCRLENLLPVGAEILAASVLADVKGSVSLLRSLAGPDPERPEHVLGRSRPSSKSSRILGIWGCR